MALSSRWVRHLLGEVVGQRLHRAAPTLQGVRAGAWEAGGQPAQSLAQPPAAVPQSTRFAIRCSVAAGAVPAGPCELGPCPGDRDRHRPL